MKRLDINTSPLPNQAVEDWVGQALGQINEASAVDTAEVAADAFTLTNFTDGTDELTDFDVSAATLAELRQIVATLIAYIQRRGPDRTQ